MKRIIAEASRSELNDGQAGAPPAPQPFAAFEIVTTRQIAERIGVCPATIKNWRRNGLLPYIVLPGARSVRFNWGSVIEALRRMERQEAA